MPVRGTAEPDILVSGGSVAQTGAAGSPATSGVAGKAGSAVSNTGGAGGAAYPAASSPAGAGGAVSNTGGVGGAAAAHAGGTAGAGGAVSSTGGVGGAASANAAGGAGGAAGIAGGAGGAGSAAQAAGAGGAATVAGGAAGADGGGGGANGGNVTIRGGAKSGSGTDGAVNIGDANTSAVNLGATGKPVASAGPLTASEGATIAGSAPAAAADKVSKGVADINGATTAAEVTVYEGGGVQQERVMSTTATVKRMVWAESVADDGHIALPAPTNLGRVTVTAQDEAITASIRADGTVTLIHGTTNTAIIDDDNKLDVINVSGNPRVKNRLGGSRFLLVEYEMA